MSLYSAKVGVINLFQRIKEDIQAVKERDPAARNSLEVFFSVFWAARDMVPSSVPYFILSQMVWGCPVCIPVGKVLDWD